MDYNMIQEVDMHYENLQWHCSVKFDNRVEHLYNYHQPMTTVVDAIKYIGRQFGLDIGADEIVIAPDGLSANWKQIEDEEEESHGHTT